MGAGLFMVLLAGLSVSPSATVPTLADKAAAAAPFWTVRDGRLMHVPTGMTVPDRVGEQVLVSIGASSHKGEGLDDAIEWHSSGRESFTSLFVFRPSLADAGIEAAMTDALIRRHYGDATRAYDDRIVAVGGTAAAARRIFYEGAIIHDRPMWTGVAVFKAGAWLVEARLSGPADKRATLEASMAQLLDGLRFAAAKPPHPFHDIAFSDCAPPSARPAAGAAPVKPEDAVALAVVMAGLDSEITEKKDGRTIQSDLTRVPDRLCRATVTTAQGEAMRLWPADDKPGGLGLTRTDALIVLDDAGETDEVVRVNKPGQPWYVVRQRIGGATFVAATDAPPSEAQTADLLTGALGLSLPWSLSYTVDAWGKETINAPAATGAKEKTP